MRSLFFIILLLTMKATSYGQGENNIWLFGINYSLDFNANPPTLRDTSYYRGHPLNGAPGHVWNYHRSIAVSGPAGDLRFIVKLGIGGGNVYGPHIWDRNEKMIAGTRLLVGDGQMGVCFPVVVPRPGNPDQYFIFVVRGNSLFYTLFDMTLNGGLGNIVPGYHNIQLTGWGTVIGDRMTAIQGCQGVWLVIRSRMENSFLSYRITASGIDTAAVVSPCGQLPFGNYGAGVPINEFIGSGDEYAAAGARGAIHASPNGKLLVMGCVEGGMLNFPGGVELFDFEKCSGKVSNGRLLETNQWIDAGCFSPDNSKLYVTENDGPFNNGAYWYGKVYQYDLSMPTTAAIIASKTLILTNPHYIEPTLCLPDAAWLGDIRLGPDGKIYLLDEHPDECNAPQMTFHIIHQPNGAGLSCNPQLEALYTPSNKMVKSAGISLQREIVTAPPPPDTLPGKNHLVHGCFADSIVLAADFGWQCYRWDNGQTERERAVFEPGIYTLQRITDCKIAIDSYFVDFAALPAIDDTAAACEGELKISVHNNSDTTGFGFSLRGPDGHVLATGTHMNGFTVNGLSGGDYLLTIRQGESCMTDIPIKLRSLPRPEITVDPTETVIRYGDSITLHAAGAMLYHWWPSGLLDTATKANPVAWPRQPTLFTAIGLNEYGCRDTGYIRIDIDYDMPHLVPNAFSPNGDGLNDVFRVEGITFQKVAAFQVFDRYGRQVFQATSARPGWDGSYKGQPCEMGTYHYYLELALPDGKLKKLKGNLHLIR